MKVMRRSVFIGVAALLACALCAGGVLSAGKAWSAEGDYILKKGKVYRVDKGKESLLEDDEPQRAETDAGLFSWILVDPGLEGYERMEGSESGIYFFLGEDERPAGFLPMKDAGVCWLKFSPSGEKLLIRSMDDEQNLGFYLVDAAKKSFVKKGSFTSVGDPFWADHHRFLFTAADPKKALRSKDRGEWFSVALYDTVEEELTVIREATETSNYILTDCDGDGGTMEILERSVKNKKDWANDEFEDKTHTVPIPAAG